MSGDRRRGNDDGTVLILVLVLMVVAGLVVVPLMTYTSTVLRANHVVSEQTRQAEAAKGGLRVALADPKRIFNDCNNSTTLASTTVNGYSVSSTCVELQEVGPAFDGFKTPIGAVAMQVGHEVRSSFSGGTADSSSVPAPAPVDWWMGSETAIPDTDRIWMPNLPKWPSIERSSTPLDMPAAYGCKVYLPGHYPDPIVISTGNVYFASGVYYFADSVTIEGDAHVIGGYGLTDFGGDCADDLQVSKNVEGDIGSGFAISGGGVTWVFGDHGRLVVDDSAGGSPTLEFNQRYDSVDRGGRINIMTVNGDAVSGLDHDVPDVNLTPRSLVQRDPDDTVAPEPISPGTYVVSSTDLTDAARLPAAPTGLAVDEFREGSSSKGLLVISWDEVTGQDAGGAVIDGYDVSLTSGPSSICEPKELVITPGATLGDPVRFTCVVDDVPYGSTTVAVAAVNAVGVGSPATQTAEVDGSDPVAGPPDAPPAVSVVDGAAADVAQISWDEPASSIPIEEYVVTALEIVQEPRTEESPLAFDVDAFAAPGDTVIVRLPAYDPNGSPLTATVNDSDLISADSAAIVTVSGLEVRIDTTAASPPGTYELDYEVDDGSDDEKAVIRLTIDPAPPATAAPIAHPVALLAEVGVPISITAPATDALGETFTVVVDDSALVAVDPSAVVTVTGLDVEVTTVAPDGVYNLPYTVTDASGEIATSSIDVDIARTEKDVDDCKVQREESTPLQRVCEIPLSPLSPTDPTFGLGYRFEVVATNAVGDSPAGSTVPPYPSAFFGTGSSIVAPLPFQRDLVPWVPDPVVEIHASDPGSTVVDIPGYVAVPMGRVLVDNPNGDAVRLAGGVLTGTFDVVDGNEVTGLADSVRVGFRNDIVLQRKVRIVSTAGTSKSVAVVQVNEDGAAYAVNEWSVD